MSGRHGFLEHPGPLELLVLRGVSQEPLRDVLAHHVPGFNSDRHGVPHKLGAQVTGLIGCQSGIPGPDSNGKRGLNPGIQVAV